MRRRADRALLAVAAPFVAAAVAMVAVAAPALAQASIRAGDGWLGFGVGWAGYGSSGVSRNGGRFSATADYFVTPRLALTADITCLGGSEQLTSGSASFTLCTGSAGALVDLVGTGRVVPYLRAGVGQSQLDRGAQAGVYDIDRRRLALHAGFGVRYHLGRTRGAAAFLDARVMHSDVFSGPADHLSLAAGFAFRLAQRGGT